MENNKDSLNWRSRGSVIFLVTLILGLSLLATEPEPEPEPDGDRGLPGSGVERGYAGTKSSTRRLFSDRKLLEIFREYNISRPYWSYLFNEPWQSLSSIFSEGYLFAAFYDDRAFLEPSMADDSKTRPAAVKVVGAMETNDIRVLCFLWYRYRTEPEITLAQRQPLSGQANSSIRAYLFHCLPKTQGKNSAYDPPEYVSLITENTVVPSNLLPVQLPQHPPRPSSVCACAGPYRGHYNVFQLVEKLELMGLLGAEMVLLYNRTVDEAGHTVLDFYNSKRNNKYHVVKIPDFLEAENPDLNEVFTGVVMNHCLFINMYRCRSLIMQDDMSVVAPIRVHRYQDMPFMQIRRGVTKDSHYEALDRTKPSAYILPNAYFFLDLAPIHNDAFPRFLTIPRYVTRTKFTPAPARARVSSVIHPLGCLYVAQGRCAELRRPYKNTTWLASRVNNSEAAALYYSYCGDIPLALKCVNSTITQGRAQTLEDPWMVKYGPDLFVQTAEVLDALAILQPHADSQIDLGHSQKFFNTIF